MFKIGDIINTEAYGEVIVVDVFVSEKTRNRVYNVEDVNDRRINYLAWGSELKEVT